jgi:branched-chain amino acid transport system substrate-binding protein
VRYIILDDASEPDNAAKNARKLISEDKADVLMGSNGVPFRVQMAQAAGRGRRSR